MNCYEIRNSADGSALDLILYDEIFPTSFLDGETSAKSIVEALTAAKSAKQINVSINSPGGNVFAGFAIHSALARHPARKVVRIDGLAASIASVIAMAGDEISMSSDALMMVHDPTQLVAGGADDLRKAADMLDKVRDNIASVYVNRTNQPIAKVREMMGAETWLTATEAKALGFCTEIEEPRRIAAHWKPEQLNNFKNVPAAALERAKDISREKFNRLVDAVNREFVLTPAAALALASPLPKPRTAEAAEQESAMPEGKSDPTPPAANAPQAASVKELKALKGASPEFVVNALENGWTLPQAQAALIEALNARAEAAEKSAADAKAQVEAATKRPGGKGIDEGGSGTVDPNSVEARVRADFINAAREYSRDHKCSMTAAMGALSREYPAAHADWLDAQPKHKVSARPAPAKKE